MDNLVLKGLTEVEGMRFHDIEGGFGEGKKSMLVKDIAIIHDRDLFKINELINKNRKRFKDYIDIIDLQGTKFAILLKDNGIYTQNAINASSNIYLLSERGYAKLLKILEDDKAWEQYDKLVDGYFEMRKTIKKQKQVTSPEDKLKLADARVRNAKARQANVLLKIANQAGLHKTYKQVLFSYASAIIAGKPLIPLPELEEETLTAEEVGNQLGITANMVGRIAKANNLKIERYGKWFHDKSRYSNKEVPSFRYYQNVIPVIRQILKEVKNI
jgi:hypothetical protein